MEKFKVGEEVVVINQYDKFFLKEGRDIHNGDKFIVNLVTEHNNICVDGLCFMYNQDHFEKVATLKSTIGKALKNYGTTKAYRNEVMAHLDDATFYQDEKLTFLKTDKGTGYALRNPEDTNDAEKGIYLAVTRIFGETKPEWQVEVDEYTRKGYDFYIMPTEKKISHSVQKYLFSKGIYWVYAKDELKFYGDCLHVYEGKIFNEDINHVTGKRIVIK